MAKKKTEKKIEGCGDPRCMWCDAPHEHLYGLSTLALRKRFIDMTQAEYLAFVVIPEEIIFN
jgi:hypothetical protein